MKNRWIVALTMGAAAAVVAAAYFSNALRREEQDISPRICDFCGDEEVMQRECSYGMDNPTLFHNRTRV